ncbi:MAG TPA: enoyl-CoA hydratase-related protein [Mycobacterium sp.]|nr:enoyl-CoA hydratase-related protein [Mycobacterium sp.]
MTDYEDILYSVVDRVATVTINRPQSLNAFRRTTLLEMTEAIDHAGADPRVGVIVLTGAGDRAFCAGGDVNWEADGGLENRGDGDRGAENYVKDVYAAIRRSLKPAIARVNGYAIGGGNHMAYFCDFTIASDNSIFGQNGPRVASPAQGWLVSYLVRVVGAKRAREMWFLCRRYTAAQALDWGLVNAVVPAADLDTEVRRWADELLAMSPTVLKLLKMSFDEEYAPLRELQEKEYLPLVKPDFFASGEQDEGARAFLEKRKPNFDAWR